MATPPRPPLNTELLRDRRDRARQERRRRRRRMAGLVALGIVLAAAVIVITSSNGSGGLAAATHDTTTTTLPATHAKPKKKAAKPKPPPGTYKRKLELAAIHRAEKAHDYVVRGTPRHKLVALTFDDGPGPTTPRIVAWLKKHDVPATFFLIGSQVNSDPDMVRTEERAGFELGDHTENHIPLATLSALGQKQQIAGGAASILAATGRHVHLLRPPEGSFNDTTLQLLHQAKLLMVLWTVDTSDYTKPGADKIVYTALSGARAGSIVLMHDGGGDRTETLAALPRIVHRLRLKGYRLVTVPQLLVSDPVPGDQPAPHSLSGG